MNFKDARKELRKVGTAHAEGDALRAMYSDLINFHHGGKPQKYYTYLLTVEDSKITLTARELLRDRAKAWDVLLA